MTLEEACRLIDPATDLDALAEIEYYNGFKGKDAAAKALHEASQMVVDFVRQMSWHDAKNPPIAHEESWECAGEKHCAVISDIVWVCCESGHTMKGWVENGTWHIEDGHRAEDGHYGHVKLWAPLLEPPEFWQRQTGGAGMKWVALIYAAEWISVGLAVSTAIHVTGNLRALWFFLIPALFGVSYHDGDEGEKK